MTSSEYAEKVLNTFNSTPFISSAFVANFGATWIKIRAFLADASYIDVFFNEVTRKTAYSWIKDDSRILGADNTQGWHWHPFEAPETHAPVEETVSLLNFLHEVEKHLLT
ncbi:MAG: hypothetical protein MAG431_01088 [Chloroflexi bacterium]|nr:hypothetical protein [Chloroflexota bacterium]